jgi:hypothetical protein
MPPMVAIQVLAVAVGYAVGLCAALGHVYSLLPWQCLAGLVVVFLVIGVIEREHSQDGPRPRSALCLLILFYCVGFLVLDWCDITIVMVLSESAVVFAAVSLLPLLAAVGPLVRADAWWSVAAVVVFIVACVGLITYNANDGCTWNSFFHSYRA